MPPEQKRREHDERQNGSYDKRGTFCRSRQQIPNPRRQRNTQAEDDQGPEDGRRVFVHWMTICDTLTQSANKEQPDCLAADE